MKIRLTLAIALLSIGLSQAHAANCTINAPAINFGVYDIFSVLDTDSTTTITITCTTSLLFETVSYDLQLSAGPGGYLGRTLMSGANTLPYNLYTSPTRSPGTIWGDGTSSTSYVSNTLPVLWFLFPTRSANHTVYGRIPAGYDAAIGNYSASLIVTLNF